MQVAKTEKVKTREVSCDGGKEQLGHPKVYLHISKNNEVVCPYCSKKFILAAKE